LDGEQNRKHLFLHEGVFDNSRCCCCWGISLGEVGDFKDFVLFPDFGD